jgi:hypothetical protein
MIPVFANINANKRIRRWRYFQHVYDIPLLDNRLEFFTLDLLAKEKSQLSMSKKISVVITWYNMSLLSCRS